MKIIFNDATELQVQSITPEGDYLNIKTIAATPEQLREMFDDPVKTKRMTAEERGHRTVYEGYTEFYRTEGYTGGIYGVVAYKPEQTPEAKKEVQEAAILVAQIQAQNLTDEQALSVQSIYPEWSGEGIAYPKDYKTTDNGILYKCLQAHTSQPDWTPADAPSLWAKVLVPDSDTVPEWEQPDSTNGYAAGDKVLHNNKIWESLVNNNVWEPGATGTESLWKEVE